MSTAPSRVRCPRRPSRSTGFIRDLEGNPTKDLTTSDVSFHALREYVPGDDVRAKIGPALEPSQVLMNERAQEAMGKALERLKAAWPEAGAVPPAAVPGPGGPAAPAGPPVPVPPSN